ncbi:MAG: spermidine synthase [Magnetococcales bacterium]|nr:spermidine synthase [Magnetococcales bacterium]
MTTDPDLSPILFQTAWQGRTTMVVDEGEYRSLYFDNQMTQSRMLLAHPLWLVLPYTRHMLGCLLFNPHPRHIFMIGLGGGSLAKFFLHYFPECRIDVVDSNPEMASIARQFFSLPIENRLTLHCADGEAFVAAMAGRPPLYDLILVDAFDHEGMARSVYASPFFMNIHPLLSEHGVLALNLNRAETSNYSHILAGITACFPDSVFRLPVPYPSRNEIIFCCREDKIGPHLATVRQQAAAWVDHQPEVDFDDFMRRMVPLKQTVWNQWMDRLQRYRGGGTGG